MTTLPASTTSTHRQPLSDLVAQVDLRRVAAATLAAAVADAGFAFVAYVLVAGRYNFETLLQYIATGVLGDGAYRSGWAGVAAAAVGFGSHLALSAGFAAGFALTAGRLVLSTRVAVPAGVAYGVAIWVLMASVVLPALGVAHEPVGGGYWWAFLVDHALLVGLPIALLTSRRD